MSNNVVVKEVADDRMQPIMSVPNGTLGRAFGHRMIKVYGDRLASLETGVTWSGPWKETDKMEVFPAGTILELTVRSGS